mmetsp:Transcript_9568/g.11914  ORF Transcript_9568/g.11914 Transcript_9568/m.11914 type:complete len:143 (+) Transcript_9568:173-601(+)
MGWCITKLIRNSTSGATTRAEFTSDISANDKYLIIAGKGHLQHYLGVPEKLLASSLIGTDKMMLVTPKMTWEMDIDEDNESDIADDQKLESLILGNELVKKSMLVNEGSNHDASGSRRRFAYPIGDILYIYDERDSAMNDQT